MDEIHKAYYDSPLGKILIEASNHGILSVKFVDEAETGINQGFNQFLLDALFQLDAYFLKKRKSFDIELDLRGTAFQLKVWNMVKNIPYGKKLFYLELAKSLGDTNLTRAVGRANGSNPISIIIPCHRVIGSNNDLVGYSGGLHRKKWLLDFESFQQTIIF